jgi:predicted dehydrogenase
LRVAIIGCGKIGSDYDVSLEDGHVYSHTKAYLLNPHAELVAACDLSASQRRAFENKWGRQVRLFDTSTELFAETPNLDLVSICTPTSSHHADLLRVLEADVPHVLCEKPLARDADEAADIARRYDEHGRVLCVNHVLRWEPGVIALKERLSSPRCAVTAVNVVYAKGLRHNGLHAVDLSLYLFGEPSQIIKLNEFEEVPGDPTCDFVLVYPEFNVSFTGLPEKHYSIFEYTIYSDDGKVAITDLTTRILRHRAVDHPFLSGYRSLSNEHEELPCRQDRNMENVINDVVEGIRSRNPSLFRCTSADAMLTMGYLQRIRESPCLAG